MVFSSRILRTNVGRAFAAATAAGAAAAAAAESFEIDNSSGRSIEATTPTITSNQIN